MRFITIRDLRGQPRRIWSELSKQGEMVVTSHGKPIAILASATEDTLEESLAVMRSARAMRAAREIRKNSARSGLDKLSARQINSEITSARRER